ncbi:MAG: SOS response-associated peptidase [Labilithrix sp.]|nr:SOS response-associated peptidase [Labilithrix sp.]
MCGRATLITPVDEIAEAFGVAPIPIGPPRFNISPGTDLLVIRSDPARDAHGELALLRWGLVPAFAKDRKIGHRLAQARAETLTKVNTFRFAFEKRRCLVVVDGFYEWSGEGKSRQPHYVHLSDRSPFTMAGLWERWTSAEGDTLQTCAVVTTPSRAALGELHDRMPLILGEGREREIWLGGSAEEARSVLEGAHDAVAHTLVLETVSTWVNNTRHDDPRCIEPIGENALC